MLKVRDGLFEFLVQGQRTGQRADAVRAATEFIHGFLRRLVDARVADQAQVPVGRVHAHHTPVDSHAGPLQDLLHRLIVKIIIMLSGRLQTFFEREDAS